MTDRLHKKIQHPELRLGLGLWLGSGGKGGGTPTPPVDAWRTFTMTAGGFPAEPDEFQPFILTAGDF